MFDIGRLCIKTAGREAGKYCVVLKKIDDNFVLVTGPRSLTQVKRRKCNILHLEPLKETLKIEADASDDEVIKAYEEASLSASWTCRSLLMPRMQASMRKKRKRKLQSRISERKAARPPSSQNRQRRKRLSKGFPNKIRFLTYFSREFSLLTDIRLYSSPPK